MSSRWSTSMGRAELDVSDEATFNLDRIRNPLNMDRSRVSLDQEKP